MPRPTRYNQVMDALRHQEVARSRFNYAVGPYVDSAVLELRAAELRLSAALTEARSSLFCPEGLEQTANRGKGWQEGCGSQPSAPPPTPGRPMIP